MKKKDYYAYETKCKRCGFVNSFYAGEKNNFDQSVFAKMMVEKSTCPSHCNCEKCKKQTFQELVSFNIPY